jgi:hypothetical protein
LSYSIIATAVRDTHFVSPKNTSLGICLLPINGTCLLARNQIASYLVSVVVDRLLALFAAIAPSKS